MQLRKIIQNGGHLPGDEAATKLRWLALRNVKIDSGVEDSDESVRNPVRRSVHELTRLKPGLHIEFLTRPQGL